MTSKCGNSETTAADVIAAYIFGSSSDSEYSSTVRIITANIFTAKKIIYNLLKVRLIPMLFKASTDLMGASGSGKS